MLGQLHDCRQGNALAAGLGHESRAQAMSAKIALQSGQASPPLNNLTHSRRGQGRADPLLPEPPEDRPFGDPGCVQPVLQGEGGPIKHRLFRGRGGRNPGLLGLAVLQPVDIARLANPAQVAQVGSDGATVSVLGVVPRNSGLQTTALG